MSRQWLPVHTALLLDCSSQQRLRRWGKRRGAHSVRGPSCRAHYPTLSTAKDTVWVSSLAQRGTNLAPQAHSIFHSICLSALRLALHPRFLCQRHCRRGRLATQSHGNFCPNLYFSLRQNIDVIRKNNKTAVYRTGGERSTKWFWPMSIPGGILFFSVQQIDIHKIGPSLDKTNLLPHTDQLS